MNTLGMQLEHVFKPHQENSVILQIGKIQANFEVIYAQLGATPRDIAYLALDPAYGDENDLAVVCPVPFNLQAKNNGALINRAISADMCILMVYPNAYPHIIGEDVPHTEIASLEDSVANLVIEMYLKKNRYCFGQNTYSNLAFFRLKAAITKS